MLSDEKQYLHEKPSTFKKYICHFIALVEAFIGRSKDKAAIDQAFNEFQYLQWHDIFVVKTQSPSNG